MRKITLFVLLALATSGLARAAEAPLPVVDLLSAVRPSDHWYGAYLNTKNVGDLHIRVEPGKKKTLAFTIEGRFRLGDQESTAVQTFVYDKKGQLAAYSDTVTENGQTTVVELVAGKKGTWTWSRNEFAAGAEPDAAAAETKPVALEAGVTVDFLITALLPHLENPAVGTTYTFRQFATDQGNLNGGSVQYLGEETMDFRGQQSVARAFRVEREQDEPEVFYVVDGKLVMVALESAPVAFLLGTPEQAQSDLPPPVLTPDEQAVSDAVSLFLEGFIMGRPDPIGQVTDLAAIKNRLGSSSQPVADMSLEEFTAEMNDAVSATAPPPEAVAEAQMQLDLVRVAMQIQVDGDEAQVFLPGVPLPILAARQEAGWRVVWWDVFQSMPVGKSDEQLLQEMLEGMSGEEFEQMMEGAVEEALEEAIEDAAPPAEAAPQK